MSLPISSKAIGDILSGASEVRLRALSGDLDVPVPEALGTALDAFLTGGWMKLPDDDEIGLDDVGAEPAERIRTSVARTLEGVNQMFARTDWSEPGVLAKVKNYLAISTTLAGERLLAGRLVDATQEHLALESQLVVDMLEVAHFAARIRAAAGRHGITAAQAAPAVYWLAQQVAEGEMPRSIPGAISVGGHSLPVAAYAAMLGDLTSGYPESLDAELALPLASYRALAERIAHVDISKAVWFEKEARQCSRQEATERVIEALMLADREVSGRSVDSPSSRLRTATLDLPLALERLGEQSESEHSTHAVYENCWTRVVIPDLEWAKKRDEVEFLELNPGFDGITAWGMCLQEMMRNGLPLSMALGYLHDWADRPEDGGIRFGPKERAELEDLVFFAAKEYARKVSARQDPDLAAYAEDSWTSANLLREKLAQIEAELKRAPVPSDADLQRTAEAMLVDREVGESDRRRAAPVLQRIITRVRAFQETRRLSALRAMTGHTPVDVLPDPRRTPHARRFSEILRTSPDLKIFSMRARNGQSVYELSQATFHRAVEYRAFARADNLDVAHYADDPTDRFLDENLVRKVGKAPGQRRKRVDGPDKSRTEPELLRNVGFSGGRRF